METYDGLISQSEANVGQGQNAMGSVYATGNRQGLQSTLYCLRLQHKDMLGDAVGHITRMASTVGAFRYSHNSTQHMMDDDDSVEILQQILNLKILDWNPLDEGKSEVAKNKPKRGRPRKRVVQRRECMNATPIYRTDSDSCAGNKPKPIPLADGSSLTRQKSNARLIRATISPVPEQAPPSADDMRTHLQFANILYEENQQGNLAEDDELDTTDILQQIMTSGILDWNPHRSSAATRITDDSSNVDRDITANALERDDQSITAEKNRSNKPKRRCPQERTARKATTHREC